MTAADLRAEIARKRVKQWVLAYKLNVHPGRLSAMLTERIPWDESLAKRIADLLLADDNPAAS